MTADLIRIHGPQRAAVPVVLDSPHSGFALCADFGTAAREFDRCDGEDCFVDESNLPATALGGPLPAAQFARRYLDANRDCGDSGRDPLKGGHGPHRHQPSGKARLGQTPVWRPLGDGRPISPRKLAVAEARARIERRPAPYRGAPLRPLDDAPARVVRVAHLNCHSMAAVGKAQSDDRAGAARAGVVLGDRDGTGCDPVSRRSAADTLTAMGYWVEVNDPYTSVALVRAHSAPARGRYRPPVEIDKRRDMDEATGAQHASFCVLQSNLTPRVAAVAEYRAR